jgi:hypothetical protein
MTRSQPCTVHEQYFGYQLWQGKLVNVKLDVVLVERKELYVAVSFQLKLLARRLRPGLMGRSAAFNATLFFTLPLFSA